MDSAHIRFQDYYDLTLFETSETVNLYHKGGKEQHIGTQLVLDEIVELV